ncbi:substrate-binding domain-containing protein [Curtobacterium sp. MCJR17_043]|uniref:substrate-binding domain-containing protein n=1 Tax=Curtobacterium sp. MCJR17_043 TaxID=2175660 RepID=UPI0032E8DE97
MASTPIPVVSIDPHTGPEGHAAIDSDNIGGARAATEHLIGLGHRRIAHIRGRADLASAELREIGYRQSLEAAGIPFDPDLVCVGDYQTTVSAEVARELLSRHNRPTAVFAANDSSAIGVLQVAGELGLRVPQDLSVVGFDDVPQAANAAPPADDRRPAAARPRRRGPPDAPRAPRRAGRPPRTCSCRRRSWCVRAPRHRPARETAPGARDAAECVRPRARKTPRARRTPPYPAVSRLVGGVVGRRGVSRPPPRALDRRPGARPSRASRPGILGARDTGVCARRRPARETPPLPAASRLARGGLASAAASVGRRRRPASARAQDGRLGARPSRASRPVS